MTKTKTPPTLKEVKDHCKDVSEPFLYAAHGLMGDTMNFWSGASLSISQPEQLMEFLLDMHHRAEWFAKETQAVIDMLKNHKDMSKIIAFHNKQSEKRRYDTRNG